MLRPNRLNYNEMVDILTALQEFFYLRTDEQGNAIWSSDWSSDVCSSDLVPHVRPLVAPEHQGLVHRGGETQGAHDSFVVEGGGRNRVQAPGQPALVEDPPSAGKGGPFVQGQADSDDWLR